MRDFFISYNKADRAWAEWIAWQLEQARYTTVIQAWDFRLGSNFVLEIQRAVAEAGRTIAVLSPYYLTAFYARPEWAAAFAKGMLLPVRVRPCELKGPLGQVLYIDFVGLDEPAAKKALLEGVREGRGKPPTAPAFPGKAPRSVPERPRFPGTLPKIWNVPHLRNPNFTGRGELLAGLRAALTSGQPAALTQAISGLGGVGKTQLAVEYAYRHAADYSLLWWMRAEEPAKLAADYALLASELRLPEKEAADQRVVVEAVRRWLGQNAGWLLIFDNAGSPGEVRDYLPQAATGHALITSRNPNWLDLARPLLVKELKRPESVEFLLRRTGQQHRPVGAGLAPPGAQHESAAAALAEALGDLPLALEQAGAYIEETATSFAGYLELFKQRQAELLGRGRPSTGYEATVATTWEILFQRVQEQSPAAAELLNLCAFLAPDDIPKELLTQGTEHLPESLAAAAADPLKLNEAVGVLRRFSLMEVVGEALSLHRLVQAVARNRLEEQDRRKWAEAALRLVNGAFPFASDDVRTWPQCSRLLPHALAAAGHGEALKLGQPTGRLLNQTGLYLRGRAEFTDAKELHERALAFAKAAYGPNHPKVATDLNNLGAVLWELGDLAGARAHFERALQIAETHYGPNHPNVATHLNNLGRVLQDLGDLAGTRANCERALRIDEAAYGPNHPEVATDLNNLGSVLRDLGDLAGARAHFERALKIDEAAYGPNHPTVAIRFNNLGLVLQALGDLAGARAHYERALKIGEAAYGPNHPTVAKYVNNLGGVLHALGDLAGARAHYERALKIDQAAYGPNHATVARDVNNLGQVLHDVGDRAGARAHLERALQILRESLGENHPKTLGVRKNLESLGR